MRLRFRRLPSMLCAAFALVVGATSSSFAVDRVTAEIEGKLRELEGRVLVAAQDGGLLFESQDARIWTLMPDQILSQEQDAEAFRYLNRAELTEAILAELPDGFRVHTTAHYLICYNTSRAYAQWCGALFERLYRAFFSFWGHQQFELQAPELLVAIVFRDQPSFVSYGRTELGDAAASVIGYYSLATNRITTYDLTGLELVRQPGDRVGSAQRINQILARPEASRTVATVIHEATHQLAFNSGLQRRFADNPLWLSEGLAIYFETPDLNSRRGWRKVGDLHPQRLQVMRNYLLTRPPDSLFTLLTDDQRFRDTQQAEVAYAEAWAVCYFLMRQRSNDFLNYLRRVGEKPVLGEDSAEERLQQFEQVFGQDWRELDAEFLRSIPTWR